METMEPGNTEAPKLPKQSNNIGPVIGIIIIVILLVLGGVYYFTTGVQELRQNDDPSIIAGGEVEALKTQGTSSDLADIEADLNATDFSGLDEASSDFDAALNAQ